MLLAVMDQTELMRGRPHTKDLAILIGYVQEDLDDYRKKLGSANKQKAHLVDVLEQTKAKLPIARKALEIKTELDAAKLDIKRLDDLIYEVDWEEVDLFNEGTDLLNAVNDEISRRDPSIKRRREAKKCQRYEAAVREMRPQERFGRATKEQLERAVEDFSSGLVTAKQTLARKNEQVIRAEARRETARERLEAAKRKRDELGPASANQGSLDTLCGDLRRVQREFTPELDDEMEPIHEIEPVHHEIEHVRERISCCRMLGLCNGRTDFNSSSALGWGSDGELKLF
jgi:chromosome segregation ATPase